MCSLLVVVLTTVSLVHGFGHGAGLGASAECPYVGSRVRVQGGAVTLRLCFVLPCIFGVW